MTLRRIEIEGFRGIRRMALDLDGTTTLIGENSCGKTSVLDALELGLGHRASPLAFGPLDFHLPSGEGAVPVERIDLRFTFEDEAGRTTVAELTADRGAEGSPVPARARLLGRDGRELSPGEPQAFAAFQRKHPVLRVRFARPERTGAPEADPAPLPAPAENARRDGEVTMRLRRTVESAYRKFSGSWRPHPSELREPTEAARALAERWSERLGLPAKASGRATEVLAQTPVVLGATDPRAPQGFAPIAIGLALTLIHLISIPVTNTSVNPARSTGVALYVGGWAVAQLWLFWVAPIAGALLGAGIHRFLADDRG